MQTDLRHSSPDMTAHFKLWTKLFYSATMLQEVSFQKFLSLSHSLYQT